jgi:hypothetical protein
MGKEEAKAKLSRWHCHLLSLELKQLDWKE